MIVRFNFKRTAEAISDIDNACVFLPRLDEHVGPILREGLQVFDGVFVGAVFTPHHGVNAHFREVGRATEDFYDFLEFIIGQTHFMGLFQCSWRGGGIHLAKICTKITPHLEGIQHVLPAITHHLSTEFAML